jgi:phage/plasmid-associated DNA primase
MALYRESVLLEEESADEPFLAGASYSHLPVFVLNATITWILSGINLTKLRNGHLVFRKGHTPDYLSRIVIPHDYNPYAQCPKVIKFLYDILPVHRVKIVLKMLGYCFQADCKHQKGFMMFGKGKNGKGVVISLIRALLGSDNCTIGLPDICESRFEKWLLDGKLANTYGDLPKRPIKDLSKFKSIVVGEELNAEGNTMMHTHSSIKPLIKIFA